MRNSEVESLVFLCGDVLTQHRFSVDTSLELLALASSCDFRQLKARLVPFIAKNFEAVKLQNHFLNLPAELLCAILSETCLHVTDEREVLSAVLMWLQQGKERSRFAVQLLQTVRFATMALQTVRVPAKNVTDEELSQLKQKHAICSSDEFSRILERAKRYRSSPDDRWSLAGRGTTPRPSTSERHLLASVGLRQSFFWKEEERAWVRIEHALAAAAAADDDDDAADQDALNMDTLIDVIYHDDRLYMAVWKPRQLLRCDDFLGGKWSRVADLPADARKGPLVIARGFLYAFGPRLQRLSMRVRRMNLSTFEWEEAPSVPQASTVACAFYKDEKIYFFEEEIICGSEAPGDSSNGVYVFHLSSETWESVGAYQEGWAMEDDSFVDPIWLEKHYPVCIDGKVYFSTGIASPCLFDTATNKFQLSDPLLSDVVAMDASVVGYDGNLVWIDEEDVRRLCLPQGKVKKWPLMPSCEPSQLVVVPIKNDRLRATWDSFLAEGRVFATPKDYDSSTESEHDSEDESETSDSFLYETCSDHGWDLSDLSDVKTHHGTAS